MAKYNTKEEVLDTIGVKSIEEVKEKEIDEFIKIRGDVAESVQADLIKGIFVSVPELTTYLIDSMNKSYKETLDANSDIADKQMRIFEKALDTLSNVLHNENVSEEVKILAIEEFRNVLKESKEFSEETQDKNIKADNQKRNKVFAAWGITITAILGVGVTILTNSLKNVK